MNGMTQQRKQKYPASNGGDGANGNRLAKGLFGCRLLAVVQQPGGVHLAADGLQVGEDQRHGAAALVDGLVVP